MKKTEEEKRQRRLEKAQQARQRQIQKQIEKRLNPSEKELEKRLQYKQNSLERQRIKQGERIQFYKDNPELRPKINKFSSKMEEMHKKDENFYLDIWNKRPHYCVECGKYLGKSFYDEEGKPINLYRYAHIIPKSKYPYLRHCKANLMLLCLNCHTKFDNSPREIYEKMKIYNENYINRLKELHKKLKEEDNEKFK